MDVPVLDWPDDRPDVPWLNTTPHFAVLSPFDGRLVAVADRYLRDWLGDGVLHRSEPEHADRGDGAVRYEGNARPVRSGA